VGSVTTHQQTISPASSPADPAAAARAVQEAAAGSRDVAVRVDQDMCTGDGLCVQLAPDIFEFDIDGLAYVRDTDGELLAAPGATRQVPSHLVLDVVQSARECPGDCIYVVDAADGAVVAGGED
jgi:ferredoxin